MYPSHAIPSPGCVIDCSVSSMGDMCTMLYVVLSVLTFLCYWPATKVAFGPLIDHNPPLENHWFYCCHLLEWGQSPQIIRSSRDRVDAWNTVRLLFGRRKRGLEARGGTGNQDRPAPGTAYQASGVVWHMWGCLPLFSRLPTIAFSFSYLFLVLSLSSDNFLVPVIVLATTLSAISYPLIFKHPTFILLFFIYLGQEDSPAH